MVHTLIINVIKVTVKNIFKKQNKRESLNHTIDLQMKLLILKDEKFVCRRWK